MKKRTKIILIIIFSAISIFLILSKTYGKYVYNSIWNSYLESKKFYFSSPSLSLNNQINTDNQWSGQSLNVTLNNYLNDSEISNSDIAYEVTCEILESSEPATCQVENAKGTLSSYGYCLNDLDREDVSTYEKIKCETSGYKWIDSKASKNISVAINSTEEVLEAKVKIIAKSISPYEKIIEGTFILNRDMNSSGKLETLYKEKNNEGYLVLTNTYSSSKCFNIKWDSSQIKIDLEENLNAEADENGYINSVTVKINSYENQMLHFYKETGEILSEKYFIISEGEC